MDGRIYVLVLSQKGRELAESIRRDRLARERQMVACLTEEERKEFVRLADKMAENLEDLEK
jgi:DNA-binding MarR family transcriptional regulator